MLTISIFVFLLILLIFLIIPFVWFGCGKLFRINDLTLKKVFLTYLLILLVSIVFQLITPLLNLIGITNIFIELFVGIVGLVITVWIIKNRFSTTIPRSIGVYISSIICIVGLALFFRAYFVQAYKIPAGSMKQSLLVGDHILVNKFIYKFQKPQKGDIIVFKFPPDPEKDFIKRVIGVAGDVIECRDKKLYVNHKPVNHDYGVYTDPHIIPAKVRPRDNFGPITVPKDSLFVMGDNRDESFDSRFWGFVDLKAVNGKAFVIYWSLNQTNAQVRFDRIGKTL